MMTFEQAISALSSLEKRGWRLGLDRMLAFLAEAGLTAATGAGPESPKYIHVAGTNGKGSTTAFLQSLLVEQGFETGAFFSPYVFDPRERVQIGREPISKEEFALGIETLMPVGERLNSTELGGPTEFEMKTALGFWAWMRQQCEWVALEVGLGGRLDATNVVTPRASVIVSIGWDHMALLGNTLGQIAAEKAGIIKPGVPVIVGSMEPEPMEVILKIARERNAPVWRLGQEIELHPTMAGFQVKTPQRTYIGLRPGLPGQYQPANMALAVAALEAAGAVRDPERVRLGVEKAWLPGRYQKIEALGRVWLLDGAHNVNAAEALAEALFEEYGPRRFVTITSMLSGHDPQPFYEKLSGPIRTALVAPIDFFRAIPPRELAPSLAEVLADVVPMDSQSEAIDAAIAATQPGEVILVTGSFYLVGQIGNRLLKELSSPAE
ncbi:MAG TPA: folylpolyglutamate synthase/dihydrofolate synthase family protein [Fimbriimonadaceae bacterium]|nr:folylpolyglutamate synthase/dihydrofolate synthase family protein [Fimbriimonadaceae bacterium]HRJ31951.1 folylpolyglutamate synthase/dihydrofolate synthase family protein [Fimbriimonadaceae bacterium]